MSSSFAESALKDVRLLIEGGQLDAARQRCATLVKMAPADSRVWCLAAEVEFQSNMPDDAAEFLQRALECAPADPAILIGFGHRLLRLGQRRHALEIALRTQGLLLESPELQDALGTLFTHLEEPARAVPFFQSAFQRAPANINFRYNLAMAQRMTGDLEAAELNLDEVIAARPDDGEAYNARSDLRKQTSERNHVNQLEAALRKLNGRRSAVPVGFALAKELEDLGEYSRSFAHLRAACQSHRASLRYNVAEDVAVLDKLRATHTAPALRKLRIEPTTEECIFIIGLPRSGTTLIERILGSHIDVFANGELDAFPRVAVEAVARQERRMVKKLEFVESTLKVDFEWLARAYLDVARPRTGSTRRFTDKQPMNYLYAGLIHAALPRARIIALQRQPMDICYAMYKTLFAAAYPFSYDLSDLARYYVAWEQLMEHWKTIIGEAWLTVGYEELVADQEGVSRKIVAHCGLDWTDECLNFHALSTPVTTASAAQVRRRLYSDSVGRWRQYANELEPLARYLEANGIPIR